MPKKDFNSYKFSQSFLSYLLAKWGCLEEIKKYGFTAIFVVNYTNSKLLGIAMF